MSSALQAMPASRLSFAGEEFAQGTIALRAAGEAVGRERLAFALEHGIDGVDQAIDRDPRRDRCCRRQNCISRAPSIAPPALAIQPGSKWCEIELR